MEFSPDEARLILALLEERLAKAHDPQMHKDLMNVKKKIEIDLIRKNEL